MLSKLEQRVRACYDACLEAVTEQHRDLWAIALLEYYRCPLEAWRAEPEKQWEQSVPRKRCLLVTVNSFSPKETLMFW